MQNEVAALINLSMAAIIVYIWFFWIPKLRIAEFRQKMFELRDRMFDDAAAGRLSFDDKAYGAMRFTMNGLIRFADSLSLSEIISFSIARKLAKEDVRRDLSPALEAIRHSPLDRRKDYHNYHKHMQMLLIELLIKRNVVLYAFFRMDLARRQLESSIKGWKRSIEAEAFAEGESVDCEINARA